ncbi:peptidoglycan-binding protein [Cryptosporangium phraense]|uniref:peptidoglycan-binding protein n=1 Tax=Cryptosporangium phraense TaxID=2593070 RepID=UPI00197AFE7A|nr:peptidoglycan-binding protein [Cryptosporangium phraense]
MLSRSIRALMLAAALVAGVLTAAPAQAAAPAAINLLSSSCPTDIVQGQTSGCVTELQNLLNAHGANITVDGNFGANTLSAVKSFQASAAIGVDGRVGPITKDKLYIFSGLYPAPVDLRSASCPSDVIRGQNSGCVVELQNLLRHYGFRVEVDGDFGPATEAAVRSFQSANGLGVDGRVGPQTKAALYNLDEGPSQGLGVDLRSSACPSNIVQGQSGLCVSTLQALLNGKGQNISVDGEFGANTAAAVRAFQSSAGIGVDGQVGPQTKTALYSGTSGVPAPINLTSSSCPTDIVKGQKSGCVTELQSLLNHHGASLAVDGDFGGLTDSAVRRFQADAGLSVDGRVGPNTKSALYGVVTPPSSPPPGGGSSAILRVAQAEADAGVREGSARANSYGQSVGLSLSTSGYAWCAVFVSWVAQQTGATDYRHSYVDHWVHAAQNGTHGLSVTTSPAPGDIVAFDWDGNGDFTGGNEHIGIVRTVSGGASFTTVEGNTHAEGSSAPDGVFVRNRSTNDGYNVLFIRVR